MSAWSPRTATKTRQKQKAQTEKPDTLPFSNKSNTFNGSLPKQTHEISFHLEAVSHQNQELGTSYRCRNLERFLLQPSGPCHRHSVGKGSCSGEKQAGQDFLMTENGSKHKQSGHRQQYCRLSLFQFQILKIIIFCLFLPRIFVQTQISSLHQWFFPFCMSQAVAVS